MILSKFLVRFLGPLLKIPFVILLKLVVVCNESYSQEHLSLDNIINGKQTVRLCRAFAGPARELRGQEVKERGQPPASEASRKYSESRN